MLFSQPKTVPSSYSGIFYDSDSNLYFEKNGSRFYADESPSKYSYTQLFGNPKGTDEGVELDFGNFEGTITYGLIPFGKAKHPLPVYRFVKKLNNGKVAINIKNDFKYPYDFVDWYEKSQLQIGYRLADPQGVLVFDGIVALSGNGPFMAEAALYEGPFVNKVGSEQATIWYNTTMPVESTVIIDGREFNSPASTHHELTINLLKPTTKYEYTVKYGPFSQTYSLTTAPEKGSSQPFVFAYASDSRHASGGGERFMYGANTYIIKKMAAVAYANGASFVQFTGDLINGYLNNAEDTHIQYTNWKKAVEPFWHYIPFNATMGNHEALGTIFKDTEGNTMAFVDKFPFGLDDAETVFAKAFVNHENGPESEDGSTYDPNKETKDFPSYKENVFYYIHGNVAVINLNSDYWYAPSLSRESSTSGGLHGYIMDNQLKWLEEVITMLENDPGINHIFVTQHTPVFPNGGHSKDDMWYSGDNSKRPVVAGKPVEKGIIERRDEYLDILINKSTKVLAVLTGDEHNYNRLKLTPEVPIYPANYPHKKLNVSRHIFQINNGACGAPYYGQETLPWSKYTEAFSVENAVCLFYVEGQSVKMKVINPDTLNTIDEITLK